MWHGKHGAIVFAGLNKPLDTAFNIFEKRHRTTLIHLVVFYARLLNTIFIIHLMPTTFDYPEHHKYLFEGNAF